MSTELPYAADAEDSLSYDELEVLRRQYQKEISAGHVTIQTKFNYAWGLIKSPLHDNQVDHQVQTRSTLFRALLLEKEPTNLQAQSLSQLIEKAVTKEGYIGMVLVGGAAAIGGLLLAGLIRRAARK
ncbi:Mitochondria fission 1 protein [Leucoagaricus sp. SymC.cos]|nr:Mitochondria fission 1 protein [Leucoagaricus sp. SymC.cos]